MMNVSDRAELRGIRGFEIQLVKRSSESRAACLASENPSHLHVNKFFDMYHNSKTSLISENTRR